MTKSRKSFSIGPVVGYGDKKTDAVNDAIKRAESALTQMAKGPTFGKLRDIVFYVHADANGGHTYGFLFDLMTGEWTPRPCCSCNQDFASTFTSAACHAAQIIHGRTDDDNIVYEVKDLLVAHRLSDKVDGARDLLLRDIAWQRAYRAARLAGHSDPVARDHASGLHVLDLSAPLAETSLAE